MRPSPKDTAPTQDPLAQISAPIRPALRRAAMLSALSALIWPVQALILAAALAGLLGAAPLDLTLPHPALLAAAVAALGLLRAMLNHRAESRAFSAADALLTQLRHALITRESQRRPRSDGPPPGETATLTVAQTEMILPALTRYGPARARVMLLPPLIALIAASQSWAVAAVFLMTGPLVPVFMALVGWAAQSASARQLSEMSSLSTLLMDRLAVLADLRLLGTAAPVVANFETRAHRLRTRTMEVLRIAFLSSTVLELLAALGVAMVAVWVGFSLLGQIGWGVWGGALSPFAGIWLLLIAPEFYQPLRDLAAAWHDRAAARAVAEQITRWQAAPPDPMPGRPAPSGGAIGWQGLVLSGGIALPDRQLAPGQMLALTGPSGAGKSTALEVLAGIEPPLAGQLSMPGGAIGWVPQRVHFLAASVTRNVALSQSRAAPIAPALRAAHIAPVIAALPQGAASDLGETGAGLSGGEARRLTLARALHSDAPVLLADEPSADLDADTAADVIAALCAARDAGRCVIVASHDPALIAAADQVIALPAQEPLA